MAFHYPIGGGGGGGGITSINGDVTPAQTIGVGTAGSDLNFADGGGGAHTINLPDAGITTRGAVTSGTQILGGNKTLAGDLDTVSGLVHVNKLIAPGAATAALAAAGAGNVDNGNHDYKVTFLTASGAESDGGTASNSVTVVDKTTNGKISVTNIPVGSISPVTARRLYRRFNGAGTYKLVANINDNTTTVYLDNIANVALGADLPGNSTGAFIADGFIISQSTAGNSNPTFAAIVVGTQIWSWGIDQNDSDKWKLASSFSVASSTRLTVDTSGNVGIGIATPLSLLHVNGSVSYKHITTTISYNALLTDHYIGTVPVPPAPITITLPSVASAGIGKEYIIKDEVGGAGVGTEVTISGNVAGENIDGALTVVLNIPYSSRTVQCTGTGWAIV